MIKCKIEGAQVGLKQEKHELTWKHRISVNERTSAN